jgi:hypothetical protein
MVMMIELDYWLAIRLAEVVRHLTGDLMAACLPATQHPQTVLVASTHQTSN